MSMPPQQQGPGAPPVQNMSQQNLNQIVRAYLILDHSPYIAVLPVAELFFFKAIKCKLEGWRPRATLKFSVKTAHNGSA